MNIKQQALEAARPHAKSIEDMLEKASKIEAYLLGTTALSPKPHFDPKEMIGQIVDTTTNEPVAPVTTGILNPFDPSSLPAPIDDADALAVVALARSLVSDLTEMGFAEPDVEAYSRHTNWRSAHEREKIRLREMADFVESCDITKGTPPPPMENLRVERKMENYETATGTKLRPMQLQVGSYMDTENLVVNVCRRFGTTTMIAAFARQEQASGSFNKILVLTNTHRNAMLLHEMIDDAAVNCYDFNQLASMTHAGESYDYILIDNAAFIPYSIEHKIKAYVEKCCDPEAMRPFDGRKGGMKRTKPARIIMASVPGQEQGWFYEAFTADDDVRKLTVDWKWSDMSAEHAAKLKREIGEIMFANQFENKFRAVEQPSGATDLTK